MPDPYTDILQIKRGHDMACVMHIYRQEGLVALVWHSFGERTTSAKVCRKMELFPQFSIVYDFIFLAFSLLDYIIFQHTIFFCVTKLAFLNTVLYAVSLIQKLHIFLHITSQYGIRKWGERAAHLDNFFITVIIHDSSPCEGYVIC